MARRNLSADEIKWILTVDAQGVQGEIQKLSSSISRLKKENKEYEAANKSTSESIKKLEKELKQLERQGKQNTLAYKNKSKELEEATYNYNQNTDAINKNKKEIDAQNKKINETIRTMKLEEMTMSQLQKRAKELESQLKHTSQSLSPESYAKLQKELAAVRGRMDQLKQSSEELNDTADKSPSILRGGLMVLAGNLMTKALGYLKQLVDTAKEWVSEGIKMAATAEGVTTAFNKLGRKDLLKNLRADTKGLVNDFTLMKAAVRADNFQIPVDKLGSLLKFAQNRAQETGKSVDYLTESIVNGIGRKSPLILDNLGISASRLQAEVKKTGDFTEAAIKIINEELEKQGDLVLTSADKATQASVKWQNAQMKVGQQLLGIKNIFSQISGSTAEWFSGMIDKYLPGFMKWLEDIVNELIEIYNSSFLVRVGVESWMSTWKIFGSIALAVIKSVGDNIMLLLRLTKSLVELDFKGGAKAWLQYGHDLTENFKEVFNTLNGIVDDGVKSINKKMEKVDFTSMPSGETDSPRKDVLTTETDKEALKKAIQERLKIIDETLAKEINLLKKRRLENEIIESDYNKRVEELTIASYHKKLEITNLEADQRLNIESQLYDALLKQQNSADSELLESLQKEQNKELQMIESGRQFKLEKLQEEETDRQLYALRAAEIESSAAESRLAIIRQFEETLLDTEFQNGENRTKAIEANAKTILSEEEKNLKARDQLQRKFLKTSADFERMYNIKTWEQRRKEELDLLSRYRQEDLMNEETYLAAVNSVNQKYDDEKMRARQQAGLTSMQEQCNAELENLSFLHSQKLLSEEEYEQAVFRIRMKYVAQYASQAVDILGKTSEIVSNLMTAETENVEARYNAEIAAAGKNAEKVEELENEKARKKLEVEKKYADVQFAITAAEIIANTAMGVMQAFAQLGPIAGAIAGALVSVVGTTQLIVANAQRKKVKSMTLGGGGSGAPSATGKITMRNEGLAEGGYNMDYSDGGYTASAGKYETTGWIPVHGGEYVVASDELARPDVADKVRSIDRIRRRRTSANTNPHGLAEGGYNSQQGTKTNAPTSVTADREAINNLSRVVQRLIDGDIVVNYGITEMEAKQRDKQKNESLFTQSS
ncbi:MAG TPA: hypothetical protein DEQ30_02985 [Porphyromonadaceae bacterium]|nr:hypothetical protein [Porphyromonadaceae bacterium]